MVGLVSTLQLLRQATVRLYIYNRKGLLQFCREQERSRGDTYHKPRAGRVRLQERVWTSSNEQPTHIMKTSETCGGGREEEEGEEEEETKLQRVRGGCLGAQDR